MIQGTEDMGIAVDNHCAIIIKDDQFKVVTAVEGANAFKVYYRNNLVVTEKIEQQAEFRNIAELVVRPL
ncbi:hypothetical protein D3C76_1835760 [compost metagenome]